MGFTKLAKFGGKFGAKLRVWPACAHSAFSARSPPIGGAGENPYGWVAPVANWGSILHGEEGPRQAHGQILRARDYPPTKATPQMITAIANNELEISNLAYSSLAIAIENAGLDDIRASPTNSRTASPLLQPQYYVARIRHHQRSKTSRAR